MDAFLGFFQFISGLGVSVMMPIVLAILGVAWELDLVRASAQA